MELRESVESAKRQFSRNWLGNLQESSGPDEVSNTFLGQNMANIAAMLRSVYFPRKI